jgi:hypothetical protein
MMDRLRTLVARRPRNPDLGPPVLLLLGVIGLAGSTRHVLRLADTHGATGPDAWLVAFVWEIMAAFSGWEIRRRSGWWRLIPTATLVAAVLFVLGANLEASGLPVLVDGAWRRVVATSPALVFLAVLALVETREWRHRKVVRGVPKPRPKPATGSSSSGSEQSTTETDTVGRGDGIPADIPAALAALDDMARAVYAALEQAGPGETLTPEQIRDRTGLDRNRAYRATRALLAADLVVVPQQGRYAARKIEAVA